jgi:chromosomal replication initiation ATPase DnaA
MISIENYAKETGISTQVLCGKSRVFHIALAREIYWLYLHEKKFSYSKIARMFNRKRHSTIINGVRTAKNMLSTNEEWALFYVSALNMRADDFLTSTYLITKQ